MNYYKEIKNLIEEKEVNDKVRYLESNKETIKTYYEIGRLLIKAQDGEEKAKYGDGLINEIKTKSFDRLSYNNKNYYVDLLLFNYKLIRYIMCELKLGEIKLGDVA